MAFERAQAYLAERGMADRVVVFDVSSATVELAAAALGCEPAHIAKTISFYDGDGAVLVVAAGDAKVNSSKFKARFGFKAKMLSVADAQERIGHGVGGVCPFGVNDGCAVYLDESLKRFETVYPACGDAASAVRLSPEELAKLLPGAQWVDVCKIPAA